MAVNLQYIAVQGAQTSGQALISGVAPVLIGGSDGINVWNVLTDGSGSFLVSGRAADSALRTGYPLLMGGGGVPTDLAAGDTNAYYLGVNNVHQAYVNTEGKRATYSACVNAHVPPANPTDWFTIRGSATKTIRITRLTVSFRATAATQYRASLIVYSVYLTGGTPSALTIVPHDSLNAAATAVIATWTSGLPTPGTAVGKVADESIPVAVLGAPVFNNISPGQYDFGKQNGQCIVLRGIAQYLSINSAGVALPAGFVADIRVQWTEE